MSPVSTLPAQLALLATFLGTLGVIGLTGRVLLPAGLLPGRRMLRLAAVMGGGLLFTTGVAALVCLRHMHVTSWLALAQVAGVAAWNWQNRGAPRTLAGAQGESAWTWAERLWVLAVGLGVAVLAVLPMIWWRADGGIYPLHEDMGFYVSQVLALPEAQAANPWNIFMGAHTVEATGIRDTWYHWGGLFLATGIRAVTGLDAAPAVLLVANGVLTFILMVAAAALVDGLWRLRPATAALGGAAALLGVHLVRLLPDLLNGLAQVLPFDVFHHVRVTLMLTFPYKYEGVLLLLTLALWQARHPRLALAVLYAAACSAPHSVAVVGAATGTLAGLGVLLRDRKMFRTGASATGAALAGWATMHFLFGAGLADKQGAPAMGIAPLAEMPQVLRNALLDIPATALMSAFFVAGAVFLVRQGRGRRGDQPVVATEADGGEGGEARAASVTTAPAHGGTAATSTTDDPRRLLGWLCLCGLAGSLLAMHALRCGDRFHVVMLTHAALVMPVGVCGLVGMVRLLSGWQRTATVAVLACVVALGLHAQISPLFKVSREVWHADDVAGLRAQLQGRPFGYFARGDRNWWISKHGLLGGLVGSRILRLNPIDESGTLHYSPYSCTLPLRWVPPLADESTTDWTLRLAQKLGVQHVLETPQDRLPKRLREKCRPLWSGSGLMLYELPRPGQAPAEKVATR